MVVEAMSLVDLGKRLLESAKLGETEEVRQLMTNGAPFTTDWLGTSPLHLAAQFGHLSTAEVLIRAGISRDARTKVDRTPLHIASQEGHIEIVELLLKNGADIEAKDMLKMTPLHWAVERGHTNVIEALLRHGADVNSMSKFEKTAVDIALDNTRSDLVETLQYADRFREEGPLRTSEIILAVEKDDRTEVPLMTSHQIQGSAALKTSTLRPILLHTKMAGITKQSHRDILVDEDSPDQSSTSVLATLAAIAEATAPQAATTDASTAETLQWLETQGITMLPADNSTIVASALDNGQTLSLTEAGKMALSWAKKQGPLSAGVTQSGDTIVDDETTLHSIVGNVNNQKVITIVADQALMAGSGTTPILVAMANSDLSPTETLTIAHGDVSSEPLLKKIKQEVVETPTDLDYTELDREQLERRFEEAQRKAEEYKEQLRMKEHEAEEYRKKLEALARQNSKT